MRHVALRVCAALLLVLPTVLAFFSGGYFAEPRLWAASTAWALVLVVALLAPTPLPQRAPGLVAVGGLVGLAVWTLLSLGWAPLDSPAWYDAQRLALYSGVAIAATALLRDGGAARAVEPMLAGGALAIAMYALSERLLPGLVDLEDTVAAFGRLEQPLTYWNALGSVTAVGCVLAIRLAGTRERSPALRVAGAAAVPWLGAALYLTLSRGALLALGVGLVVLLLVAADRAQLRAVGGGVAVVLVVALAAELLPELGGVTGEMAARERQGAVMLAVLASVTCIAAAAWLAVVRREANGTLSMGTIWRPPAWAVVAVAALGLVVAGTLATGGDERPVGDGSRASAERLRSVDSNRYSYWDVALGELADGPLRGGGSGSFRVAWLRERDVPEVVQDAHSLTLETAAELGLVGLAFLFALLGGTAVAAARALRRQRALAAGAVAALAAWAVHAQIDWLWEMPASALPALLLAGLLVALSESGQAAAPADDSSTGDRRAASRSTSDTAATAASTTTDSSAA
jgi:hypothetical protein